MATIILYRNYTKTITINLVEVNDNYNIFLCKVLTWFIEPNHPFLMPQIFVIQPYPSLEFEREEFEFGKDHDT